MQGCTQAEAFVASFHLLDDFASDSICRVALWCLRAPARFPDCLYCADGGCHADILAKALGRSDRFAPSPNCECSIAALPIRARSGMGRTIRWIQFCSLTETVQETARPKLVSETGHR